VGDSVRIHGYLVSTWTRTAVMTCIEKGVDHELVPIAYGSDEHAALHPFKRIPVLEHGDTVVAEALAIASYIDEAFDGPALQPADTAGRTKMRQWLSMCADYGYRDVVRTIPRGRAATDEELATARAVLERFDARVEPGPFLVGDNITLADLYLAPQIANAREKAPEVLDGLEALDEWMTGIAARESFRQTSYDLTPG
jgi:glutathione S-transferase